MRRCVTKYDDGWMGPFAVYRHFHLDLHGKQYLFSDSNETQVFVPAGMGHGGDWTKKKTTTKTTSTTVAMDVMVAAH